MRQSKKAIRNQAFRAAKRLLVSAQYMLWAYEYKSLEIERAQANMDQAWEMYHERRYKSMREEAIEAYANIAEARRQAECKMFGFVSKPLEDVLWRAQAELKLAVGKEA